MPGSGDHDTRPDWPIRHALDRLLAQDSWEKPYVDAGHEALDALVARVAALEHAMRENVGDAYNLLTQGESPTQRRGPSAQRIYDRSRDALAKADES